MHKGAWTESLTAENVFFCCKPKATKRLGERTVPDIQAAGDQ